MLNFKKIYCVFKGFKDTIGLYSHQRAVKIIFFTEKLFNTIIYFLSVDYISFFILQNKYEVKETLIFYLEPISKVNFLMLLLILMIYILLRLVKTTVQEHKVFNLHHKIQTWKKD